jgi:hypothetical protein
MNLPIELKRALENDRWINFFRENALLHSGGTSVISEETCLNLVVVNVGYKRERD